MISGYTIFDLSVVRGAHWRVCRTQKRPTLRTKSRRRCKSRCLCSKRQSFFSGKRYRDAARKYESAIKVQPTLGEAYYNLGLALYRRGLYAEARPHFEKAAQLEPYNQVIRNAPPFRKYGTPKPKANDEPRDPFDHETD